MRVLIFIFVLVLITSCSAESSSTPEENTAPPTPDLIYPSNNLLCIENQVVFKWSPVSDPDNDPVTYTLEVANDRSFTSLMTSRTLQTESFATTLPKGADYYWRVSAADNKSNSSPFTTENAFYVEGEPGSNYIPFKAKQILPAENSTIQGNKVVLEWSSKDLDQDDLYYDIYFGANNDPALIAEKQSANKYEVALEANKVYYWRIDTSDGSSKSLGDVWSFKTE